MEGTESRVSVWTGASVVLAAITLPGMACCANYVTGPLGVVLAMVGLADRPGGLNRSLSVLGLSLNAIGTVLPLVTVVGLQTLGSSLDASFEAKEAAGGAEGVSREAAVEAPSMGGWRIDRFTDRMTDAETRMATLYADEAGGVLRDRASLVVRCRAGETDLMFDWGVGIPSAWRGRELTASAQLRFDDALPFEILLDDAQGISTTHFARGPVSLAKDLSRYTTLTTSVVDVLGGDTRYATFQLLGAEVALAPVREACSW